LKASHAAKDNREKGYRKGRKFKKEEQYAYAKTNWEFVYDDNAHHFVDAKGVYMEGGPTLTAVIRKGGSIKRGT